MDYLEDTIHKKEIERLCGIIADVKNIAHRADTPYGLLLAKIRARLEES